MVSDQQLARSIVRESLRPKEYEPVIISTYPHTIGLAESVALECQKLGADPALFLDTDAIFYGQFKNYSDENLKHVSAHCIGLSEYARSYVWLGGPRDPGPMRRVPREKFGAMFEGEEAHHRKSLEKKSKNVGVSIGMVTRERARTYGFNFAKWKESVEGAIAVNYARLESFGEKVEGLLSQAADVRVTADNGTDLRFRLAGTGRRVDVNDGVISDEDLARENTDASLPAGSAWVAPVESSAEGAFVCDVGIPQVGRVIDALAWTFRDGRVVDFSAKRNVEAAQSNWDSASGAKDMFGTFALGFNPKAKPGFLLNSEVSGTVTIGIGDNRGLGGKNESSYGFLGNLARGTVTIDGRTVIARGAWKT